MKIIITGDNLNLLDFIEVARFRKKIELSKDAIDRINLSHQKIIDIIKSKKTIYGVNTGFGKLSDVVISNDDLSSLQYNLLKSHACGVGKHLSKEVVRGIMLLRINALSKGFSGVSLKAINQLILYLNEDIIPAIPEQGSLGASGDLAPLAHMGLSLIGEGEVYYKNNLIKTSDALKQVKIPPLEELKAKEGLSLINGTQVMTSIGAITCYDSIKLLKQANIAASLSLEALLGIRDAFNEQVHLVRGQKGQIKTANNIRKITENSTYLSYQGEYRVQDAYSLRCISQVHGSCLDTINYAKSIIEIEMNAATDNPLIFEDNMVISGGNFHGEPIAFVLDFLKIALSEVANISERRIERLVNPQLNCGLPPFLVAHPGLNSGFMIVQYSAASLVSENKVLSHPASVDSIPSSANQEDHVSMGTISARNARDILKNSQKVIAMELFSSCQAIDLRERKKLGRGSEIAYQCIRSLIPFIENDEIMYPFINKIIEYVMSNKLVEMVEKNIGILE